MESVVSTMEPPFPKMNRDGILEHSGTVLNDGLPPILKELFTDVRYPVIRSSALTLLEHCPRKFLYQEKLGLRHKGYSSALYAGNVFHLVLQALFTGADKDKALHAADASLNRLTNELIASADPAGFTPTGAPVLQVIEQMTMDFHKSRAMAFAFMDLTPFSWEEWEILETPDGTPCVELKLEAKIQGISVPLVAPCDLALLKKGTSEVWIVDHKTTSMKTLARARSVRISSQIALYRLVLQCHLDTWHDSHYPSHENEYPPLRVVGSIHNIVKKPSIKYCPKTKDKDGFQSYIARVKTWYQDEHKKDPTNSPILQTTNRFNVPVLNPELFLRLQQTARASRTRPDLDRFYRAGDYACMNFNRECEFSELCSSDVHMWEPIIERRFDIKFREDEEENQP